VRVRIKVSGHLCVKCSCDSVGRCGDLVRVASERSVILKKCNKEIRDNLNSLWPLLFITCD
jgi:hypothetical protein